MKFLKLNLLSKCFIAFILLFLTNTWVMAQITITGTVIDRSGPLPGVNILVKGTANGAYTDTDGKFTLTVSDEKAVLVFSFIGYITQEIPVGSQREINVILEEEMQRIDEVVVIGYGSVKRTSLTTAVSKMESQALEDRPLARVENALQGQLAGVMVRTSTGEPGQDIFIRVRGAASINANANPLYVVDGMPLSTLNGVNPADIESIEVLKDAAASAIYGSRGSNGVILVTTKKGKQGKARVTLTASYGVQSMEKKLDVLSSKEWMEFRIKANDSKYINDAKARNPNTTASISDDNLTRRANMGLTAFSFDYDLDSRWFKYLGNDIRASHPWYTQQGDADALGLEMLDWQEEFWKPAGVTDITLTVSGGSDNTSYMFSGGVFRQDGLAYGTNYNRYSFRMNMESKINRFITIGMQIAPSYMTRDNSDRADAKDSRGAHYVLVSLPVAEPGTGYYFNTRGNPDYAWHYSGSANKASPFAFMDNIRRDDMLRMNGSAFLRITPIDGLRIELSGFANYYHLDGQTYTFTENDQYWALGEGQRSSAGHNTRVDWRTKLQGLINYDKQFGMHNVSVMLGAEREESSVGFTTNQTYNYPFPNDNINYTFSHTTSTVSASTVSQLTPSHLVSFLGRLQYDYNERYLISASLRYDGGSMFGINNKWGLFPAISGGWNISREQFFRDLDIRWLNTLKLRASYGATGNNAISNSASYATLSGATYSGLSGYTIDTGSNQSLGWEKANSTDLAMDLGFLNNRIQFSFDWYTKKTNDLLYQVPSMGASGSTTVWSNAGEISNQGIEIELNTANFTRAFKWNTSFNLSYNVNEVKQLGTANTTVYNSSTVDISMRKVGEPLNVFYLVKNIGVWKNQEEIDAYAREIGVERITYSGTTVASPGDPRYEDVNKDGNIDFTTGANTDRQIVGNPQPKFTYGMTNRLSYKGFDLYILMTAQTGGHILGLFGRQYDRPGMSVGDNVAGRWRNAWWSENDPGDGKTPYIFSPAQGGNADTRWLYKSDYLRIKNLTLGYKIPVNPRIISNLRAYISIENLAKWDYYYNGFSPEAANTSNASWGIDYSGYPIARTFTFGLNVNF